MPLCSPPRISLFLQLQIDPPCRVLVVKKIFLNAEEDRRAARTEAVLLQSLRHPHIVLYHGSFIQDNSLHIVMEYCERRDLAAMLTRQLRGEEGAFTEDQVLDIFSQVVQAVAFIHEKEVRGRRAMRGAPR